MYKVIFMAHIFSRSIFYSNGNFNRMIKYFLAIEAISGDMVAEKRRVLLLQVSPQVSHLYCREIPYSAFVCFIEDHCIDCRQISHVPSDKINKSSGVATIICILFSGFLSDFRYRASIYR
jgi:hypothetical protein